MAILPPKKVRKKLQNRKIGEWMLTYSDMVTLLLTFFILILSFSTMDVQRYKGIALALQDAFGLQAMNPLNLIVVDNPPRTDNVIEPIKPHKSTELENEPTEIEKLGNRLETNFVDEIERGLVIVERDENHIIIRFPESAAFKSASDYLEPQMVPIIQRVADIVSRYNMFVVVGGYTDNQAINTDRFRSNWDLSAARAVSVAHELTWMSKINEKYLYVVGNGDARPIASNNTQEGREKNRRVEILLMERDTNTERNVFQGIKEVPFYK